MVYMYVPWVWGRMRLYGVQGTQSVRAEDEPETRPIIGEEGSTLRLTTTKRRLKPRTSPESQPRLGFTGASKKFCPSSFFFHKGPSAAGFCPDLFLAEAPGNPGDPRLPRGADAAAGRAARKAPSPQWG